MGYEQNSKKNVQNKKTADVQISGHKKLHILKCSFALVANDVRVDIGLYPISRYNRRIDAGYLHFCPINITFKWVMNKTPRKMYKTKRPPMYKSAVKIATYPEMFICVCRK